MIAMMSNVAIITTLPHLKEHFSQLKEIEFYSRLIITLPSLAVAFLSPFLGHLIYKLKRKHVALVAVIFFSLFGSAGLYLDNMQGLLLSRALLGIAIATLMIITTSLVGDYFEEEARHKYMGLQSTFTAVGGMIFLLSGGYLSDLNWRYPFGIYLIGLLYIPLIILYLKEPLSHQEQKSNEKEKNSLLGIYFLAFLVMLVFYIMPTQFPFLIIEHFKQSGTYTGTVIATVFVSNAIGALAYSKLKKHLSFTLLYLMGMILLSISFILIGLTKEAGQLYFSAPILGIGAGILITNIIAWVLHKSSKQRRVKSTAYATSALFLGQFFSPIVFHPIIVNFGIKDFFWIIGLSLFFISTLFLMFLWKKIGPV